MTTTSATSAAPPVHAPSPLRRTGRAAAYLLTGFPIAVVSSTVLVSGLATGASLLITLVGLPVLVLTWLVAGPFARLERRRIAWTSGRVVPEPAHRPRTRHGVGALLDVLRDPQRIRDVVHGVGIFAVSCATWTVGVVWAAAAPLTVLWLVSGADTGSDAGRVPHWLGVDSPAGRTALNVAVAGFCLLTLPYVVRGLAALQVAFGRALLTQPETASRAHQHESELVSA